MSRSYRKNPHFGFTSAISEKWAKQKWHRRWRRGEKLALIEAIRSNELEDYLPLHYYMVSNPWSMPKDGKMYWPMRDGFLFTGSSDISLSQFISIRDRQVRRFLFK